MTEEETESLVDIVSSGNVHQLLVAVRRRGNQTVTADLDLALHKAACSGEAGCMGVLLEAGAGLYSSTYLGNHLLNEAVYSGSVEAVRVLLQHGYQMDYQSGDVATTGYLDALHIAIDHNDMDIISLLLTSGVKTENRDEDGDTPLIVAANAGNLEAVCQLILAKCDINAAGYQNNTALHRAVGQGEINITQELLVGGADPNLSNDDGNTPLLVAASQGHIECAMMLLAQGAFSSHVNNMQQTALHITMASDTRDLIGTLVDAGCNINSRDVYGSTALVVGTYTNNAMSVVELLRHQPGGNMAGADGRTALHWTCVHGEHNVINFILKTTPSININSRDKLGDTPLIIAAQSKQNDCIKVLLEADCDVTLQGQQGRTVLHWLALGGCSEEIIDLVLASAVPIDCVDNDGSTALIVAAMHFQYDIMEALFAHGCAVNVIGPEGRTALHWMAAAGRCDMTSRLLGIPCDVNTRDAIGNTPLLLAAQHNHTVILQELVTEAGADVNATNGAGKSALHWLAYAGQQECVELLLKYGANPDMLDTLGDTPLILAASGGNYKTMELLVQAGSDTNAVGSNGRTALHFACQKGMVEACTLLLEKGAAKPDGDKTGTSPLMQAAKNNHKDIVQMLLQRHASTNRRDVNGRTALMWAALGGHLEVSEILLSFGADALCVDDSGDTALTLSAWHGRPDITRLLIPISQINHREKDEGMTALQLAITKDHVECARLLLQAGADIEILDAKNNNAFIVAAKHTSDSRIIKIMLENQTSVNINRTGEKGRNALHWAVGDPDTVQELFKYKPGLNILDGNGASPLLLAIAHHQPRSAKLLIEAGCDLSLLHGDGRMAIHHAALYGEIDVVKLLLDKGVDPDSKTEDGRTPILLAAMEGHTEIIRLLLQHKCDVNRVYFDAITVLSVAVGNKHYQTVKVLLDAGANPNLIGSQKHPPLVHCIFNDDIRGLITLLQGNAHVDQVVSGSTRALQAALVKNDVITLCVLSSIECDVNYIRQMFADGAIFYFVENRDILAGMKRISLSPRSLKMMCRNFIRRIIPFPFMKHVRTLPVPQMIMDYLGMRELWKLLEE